MKLGAFSISLSVKDIHASLAFYTELGFESLGGNAEDNWAIIKNEDTVIGLFQGMFEGNLLTFNPGWDQLAQNLNEFTDVRDIRAALQKAGLNPGELDTHKSIGPASFTISDPDGNVILFDQHR